MPPLTQTLEELEPELHANLGLRRAPRAADGGRRAGPARRLPAARSGGSPSRPTVRADGIGSRLLRAVEERGVGRRSEAELFTGSLSEANLRLYRREGYVETERVTEDDGIDQVFLRKRLR